LLAEDLDRIEVSFDEINAMIASALPPSARKYRAWWGNESGGHVQASARLGVGWKVEEVDFSAGLVKFKRPSR
jgi:hypothetical protein